MTELIRVLGVEYTYDVEGRFHFKVLCPVKAYTPVNKLWVIVSMLRSTYCE
jgi:hypothetical protein